MNTDTQIYGFLEGPTSRRQLVVGGGSQRGPHHQNKLSNPVHTHCRVKGFVD